MKRLARRCGLLIIMVVAFGAASEEHLIRYCDWGHTRSASYSV